MQGVPQRQWFSQRGWYWLWQYLQAQCQHVESCKEGPGMIPAITGSLPALAGQRRHTLFLCQRDFLLGGTPTLRDKNRPSVCVATPCPWGHAGTSAQHLQRHTSERAISKHSERLVSNSRTEAQRGHGLSLGAAHRTASHDGSSQGHGVLCGVARGRRKYDEISMSQQGFAQPFYQPLLHAGCSAMLRAVISPFSQLTEGRRTLHHSSHLSHL